MRSFFVRLNILDEIPEAVAAIQSDQQGSDQLVWLTPDLPSGESRDHRRPRGSRGEGQHPEPDLCGQELSRETSLPALVSQQPGSNTHRYHIVATT